MRGQLPHYWYFATVKIAPVFGHTTFNGWARKILTFPIIKERESQQKRSADLSETQLSSFRAGSSSEGDQLFQSIDHESSEELNRVLHHNAQPKVIPRQDGIVPNLLYQPGVILRGCLRVRNCIIRVIRGDLTKHSADIIVNSGSGEFSKEQKPEAFSQRNIWLCLYLLVLMQDKCSNCRAVLEKNLFDAWYDKAASSL